MATPPAALQPLGAPATPFLLTKPPELPDGLPTHPRVLQLTDVDAVSHGLADGMAQARASDDAIRRCLAMAEAAARNLDPHARIRGAASSQTAACHLAVLASAPGNTWVVRRGLDGADHALLEELDGLITGRLAARQKRRSAVRLPELVVLVAQDKIFAPPIRQLRLIGVPTWLLVPGFYVAARLYSAATAVTFIGPRQGMTGRLARTAGPRPCPSSARR